MNKKTRNKVYLYHSLKKTILFLFLAVIFFSLYYVTSILDSQITLRIMIYSFISLLVLGSIIILYIRPYYVIMRLSYMITNTNIEIIYKKRNKIIINYDEINFFTESQSLIQKKIGVTTLCISLVGQSNSVFLYYLTMNEATIIERNIYSIMKRKM